MEEIESGSIKIEHWVDGQHYEFSSTEEFLKWQRSEQLKKHPELPKLEAELKQLQEQEPEAFENAQDVYKEITLQNTRINDAIKQKTDIRVIESLRNDLTKLYARPEVMAHREIVHLIVRLEAKIARLCKELN